MNYNIVYIGNSAKVCDYINCEERYNVIAVICQDIMVNEELLTCTFTRGIPLIEINKYTDLTAALDGLNSFDFCLMCSFGMILKKDILDSYTVYNMHTSILPQYKGKNPTFHATMAGEKRIGISMHKVITGIDEGEIISQKVIPYYYWMSENSLYDELFKQTPALINDLADYLLTDGTRILKNAKGSYYPAVTAGHLQITEQTPPKDILNLIRTQERYPGAVFTFKDQAYFIRKANVGKLEALATDNFQFIDKVIIHNNRPYGIIIDKRFYIRFLEIIEKQVTGNL